MTKRRVLLRVSAQTLVLAFSLAIATSVAFAGVSATPLHHDDISRWIRRAHLLRLTGGHPVRMTPLWVLRFVLANSYPRLGAYIVDDYRVKIDGVIIGNGSYPLPLALPLHHVVFVAQVVVAAYFGDIIILSACRRGRAPRRGIDVDIYLGLGRLGSAEQEQDKGAS